MLNVSKTMRGDILEVRFSGSIEETTNLRDLIGPTPKELHVLCKDVPRLNSMGVFHWVRYFTDVRKAGTQLTFKECSTAIVEQMNYINNFTAGATIESVCVPFVCQVCKKELIAVFKTGDLRKIDAEKIEVQCTRCNGRVVFDDDPHEFFRFLWR